MDEATFQPPPKVLDAIMADTRAIGFQNWRWRPVGALLRVMAALEPGGRLLEIGTGTGSEPAGCCTAWTPRRGCSARPSREN
jgi:predicted O-methyltransferase YrrM